MFEDSLSRNRWWNEKPEKAHEAITALVDILAANQRYRQENLLTWFRLYGNFQARSLTASGYNRPKGKRNNRLTWNLVKSCVDTVHSKIAKNKPKPTFLTNGGTWKEQQTAKRLDRFCQGLFYQTNTPRVAAQVWRDALVFGTGLAMVGEHPIYDRVHLERAFPTELFVDEKEAINGDPRSLYRRKPIDRDKVIAMFPEHEKFLRTVPRVKTEGTDVDQDDLIQVDEAWHLPSGRVPEIELAKVYAENEKGEQLRAVLMDGHDGRHAIVVEGKTLYFGEWRRERFPLVRVHWTEPQVGYWGQGIPEEIIGIQYEVNLTLRQIQACIPWAVPRCYVPHGSKVVLEHLNDEVGAIIRHNPGLAPQILAASTVAPELFSHLDRQARSAYEQVGISQLSAQAKKPAGLESGAALREMNDIESDRFASAYGQYEQFHLELAEAMIDVVRDIHARTGKYGVTASNRLFTLAIDWSEIDLKEDAYKIQVFPTSSLPHRPEGRLAMVDDLAMRGYIDRDRAISLLNFPDLESANQLAEASSEFCNMQIEQMVEHGKPQLPHPIQNISAALDQVKGAYLLAKTVDVSDDRLQLLQNYIDACVRMLDQAGKSMPPAPPAGAPGAPPMGGPAGAPPAPGPMPMLP